MYEDRIAPLGGDGPVARPPRADRPRHALPRRPRRRARPARHQDDGARGPRAAVEHGRRHADAGPRPPRPAGRRPPPPGIRPGHEPGHRPRARARGDGPAGRARPAPGAARRAAARAADPYASSGRSWSTWRACSAAMGEGRATVRTLDATWDPADGPEGLAAALDRLAGDAVAAARGETALLVLTDAAWSIDRLPIPSILATGAVHTALTAAGLRGRTDIAVSAVDILDVHAMAMVLAVGATAVHPRLAIELAGELAGSRGAETLTPDRHDRPPDRGVRGRPAQDAGPDGDQRGRVVHRRGAHRCRRSRRVGRRPLLPDRRRVARPDDPRRPRRPADPPARRGPGHPRTGRRPRAAAPRPGLRAVPGRRRGAPLLAEDRRRDHAAVGRRRGGRPGRRGHERPVAPTVDEALARYRAALARPAADRAVPRDELRIRAASVATPLAEVEDARSIVRRFVVSAMSVGALSPEAHQALTIGIQRAGGAANTGEGGEDPAWYVPGTGRPPPRRADQAGRLGTVRGDRRVPRPSRPARDQDRPGLQARRGRAAPRAQGDGLHRRPSPRPARPELHQPAAPPRHLLDRGPRPADRRPARHQPAGAHRGQARRQPRGRDDRRGRRQGRRLVHPPVRPRRRDRRLAAVVDQARRGAVGARPGRGPPGPAAQRPARSRRAAHRWRAPDRARPDRRGAPGRGGVRVRDGGARRDRLRHGPPVPPRHLSDRDRHPARGPAGQVRRHARRRGPLLHRDRRGPPPRAGGGRGTHRSARSSARAVASSMRLRRHGRNSRRSSARGPGRPPRRGERTRRGRAARSGTPRHRRSKSGSPPRSAARDPSPPPGCG